MTFTLKIWPQQKKFFELFKTEDTEAQKPLICPGVTTIHLFMDLNQLNMTDSYLETKLGWITLMTLPMMPGLVTRCRLIRS